MHVPSSYRVIRLLLINLHQQFVVRVLQAAQAALKFPKDFATDILTTKPSPTKPHEHVQISCGENR